MRLGLPVVATALTLVVTCGIPVLAQPVEPSDPTNESDSSVLDVPPLGALLPAPGEVFVPPPLPEPAPTSTGGVTPDAEPAPRVVHTPMTPHGRVWTFSAEQLVLHGLRYHGHHDEGGTTTLRFTATAAEISGMRQRAELVPGSELGLKARQVRLEPAGAEPIALSVQQLTGTFPVAGPIGVPLSVAAPLLPDTTAAEIAELPELTVRQASVRLTSITGATVTMNQTEITTASEE